MIDRDKSTLNVVVDSRKSTFYETMSDLIYFQETSGLVKKEGLMISCTEISSDIVKDSEYDIHAGTEFSNTRIEMEPRRTYVPIDEVYDTIDTFVRPGLIEIAKKEIEKRFSKHMKKDGLPYSETFEFIFNNIINISKREAPDKVLPKYIN